MLNKLRAGIKNDVNKAKEAVKNSVQNEKAYIKQGIKVVKNDAKKIGKKTVQVVKKVEHIATKVFPLTAAGRAGLDLCLRKNGWGIALKLAPAIINNEKWKPESIIKAKEAYNKALNLFINLGGEKSTFDNGIKTGYKKKVFKISLNHVGNYDNYYNFAGVDDATIISAAAGIIAAVIKMISNSKADANPYQNSNDGGDAIDNTNDTSDLPKLDTDSDGNTEINGTIGNTDYGAVIDKDGNLVSGKINGGKIVLETKQNQISDNIKYLFIGLGVFIVIVIIVKIIKK